VNKKYLGRYRTIACVVALLFGVLITRLFNLQIAGYDDNLSSAESKKTKTITSQGSRGTIMDVNSLTLAYDKQIYNVQFYRDPNYTPTDIDETTGKTISQYKVYTNAIINVIDIIEKNGGTLNTSFSLVQDEMTGLWVFTWNNNKYTQAQQDAREKMWRSNFYVSSTTAYPQQQLFEKLCSKYRIPEELSTEKKIQVLSVWETMQNNAFLSQPITIASNVSWETVIEIEAKALTMEGISVSVSTQRVYPNGTLACHVVGYIGKIQNYDTYYTSYKDKGYALSDLIGLDGVEKTMEDWLSACTTQRVGKRVVEIDRYGAVSRTLSSTEATDGNNIKLTISSASQKMRWKKTSTTSAISRRLCSTAIPGWIRTRPTFRARRAILKPTRLSWRKRARSSSSTWKAVFWRWRAIRPMIPMRLSSAAMRRPISCWIPETRWSITPSAPAIRPAPFLRW